MIPPLQSFDLFRPIAHEDSEIVKPRCRKDNVVIVGHVFADLPGKSVEPRLMAKLVYGTRFFFDDTNNRQASPTLTRFFDNIL